MVDATTGKCRMSFDGLKAAMEANGFKLIHEEQVSFIVSFYRSNVAIGTAPLLLHPHIDCSGLHAGALPHPRACAQVPVGLLPRHRVAAAGLELKRPATFCLEGGASTASSTRTQGGGSNACDAMVSMWGERTHAFRKIQNSRSRSIDRTRTRVLHDHYRKVRVKTICWSAEVVAAAGSSLCHQKITFQA